MAGEVEEEAPLEYSILVPEGEFYRKVSTYKVAYSQFVLMVRTRMYRRVYLYQGARLCDYATAVARMLNEAGSYLYNHEVRRDGVYPPQWNGQDHIAHTEDMIERTPLE